MAVTLRVTGSGGSARHHLPRGRAEGRESRNQNQPRKGVAGLPPAGHRPPQGGENQNVDEGVFEEVCGVSKKSGGADDQRDRHLNDEAKSVKSSDPRD